MCAPLFIHTLYVYAVLAIKYTLILHLFTISAIFFFSFFISLLLCFFVCLFVCVCVILGLTLLACYKDEKKGKLNGSFMPHNFFSKGKVFIFISLFVANTRKELSVCIYCQVYIVHWICYFIVFYIYFKLLQNSAQW